VNGQQLTDKTERKICNLKMELKSYKFYDKNSLNCITYEFIYHTGGYIHLPQVQNLVVAEQKLIPPSHY
jgi:hypothetical protein